MSDPVTNVEIEDVLSSIRRLVSSDPSDETAQDATTSEGGNPSENRSEPALSDRTRTEPKLVLTPAQRVKDAHWPSAEKPVDDDAREEAQVKADDENDEDDVASDADEEAVVEPPRDFSEDEDDALHAEADTDEAGEPRGDAENALLQMIANEVASKVEEDAAAEIDHQLSHRDHEDAVALDQVDMDASEPFADDEDGSTPDAGFDDMSDRDVPEFLRGPASRMEPLEDAEIVPEAAQAEAADGAAADPELDPPVRMASHDKKRPLTLTAKLESLEAAVSERVEDWEPDGGEAESLTGEEVEPLPWKEIEVETADMAQTDHGEDSYAGSEAVQPPTWFGDDAVLDEDALRDMVSEIVRQELQGALGERITRNVRKLVRREIHRALMSQGLD